MAAQLLKTRKKIYDAKVTPTEIQPLDQPFHIDDRTLLNYSKRINILLSHQPLQIVVLWSFYLLIFWVHHITFRERKYRFQNEVFDTG